MSLPQNSGHFLHNQRGAILLMLLVSVSLLGLMAGIAGSSWQTIMQRSKEADLLWKGNQIRKAIGSYYEFSSSKGAKLNKFPESFEDLLQDSRALETTRYLRQLYRDPMTGEEWESIKAPNGGGIMGVRSTSEQKPMKQYGFSDENKKFIAQKTYQSWTFIYIPQKKQQNTKVQPAQSGGISTN